MTVTNKTSRRTFLKNAGKASAFTAAAVAFPTIVPSYVMGQNPPSDKLNIGIIGLGWRGNDLINMVRRRNDIQVAAICDVDRPFLLRARAIFDDLYDVKRELITGSGGGMKYAVMPPKAVEAYAEYERLLDRKDIDAVMIAVPDHWHAKLYIDSMKAGKDVYGEKPLSLVLNEGRDMVRVARETGRVFQTGSQQRSDNKFRTACEYVRSGRLGKLSHVDVRIGGSPQTQGVPDEAIPPGFDWDRHLGPAKYVPYNPLRSHVTFRWFFEYSGGMVTDWGAHHLDIMQWGLGMDGSGPLSVEGTASVKPGYYNTFTDFDFTFEYPGGVKVFFNTNGGNGVTFHGTKGNIFVTRGQIKCEPEGILQEPLKSSDVHLYKSNDHLQNWLDCIKTRERPICDVEIGHRSASICHLANTCGKLNRKLYWDAKAELFINDTEANTYLDTEERAPYQRMG